jgi:hypothetical protein
MKDHTFNGMWFVAESQTPILEQKFVKVEKWNLQLQQLNHGWTHSTHNNMLLSERRAREERSHLEQKQSRD